MRLVAGLRRYRDLLQTLIDRGYDIRPLGMWARDGRHADRTVLLRHDVDQDPRAAGRMAEIENELGVSGTWYVRWRTASPSLIGLLKQRGLEVGLHYESLSRLGRRLGARTPAELEPLVPVAAAYLAAEIRMWAHLFGDCPSICPHGDTGLPAARNADLVGHIKTESLDVDFDARAAMAQAQRSGWTWVTDGSFSRTQGLPAAADLLDSRHERMMLVIHPHNWARARRWDRVRNIVDDPPC